MELLQVSHGNIDGIINAFQALVKADVSSDEWLEILVNAQVVGNIDLQNNLHDSLMENGGKVLTKEDLILLIEKLKQTK